MNRTDISRATLLTQPEFLWRALAILIALPFLWFVAAAPPSYDDPYITLRYAQNLLNGLGFVYNPGERVLSTTTPLFTLLLVVLSPLQPELPRLANILSFLSLIAASWLLPDVLLPRLGAPQPDAPDAAETPAPPIVVRALLSLLLLLLQPVLLTFGSETCFYLFLALLTLWLLMHHRYGRAGFCAGLAAITRGDGMLLLPIVLWQIMSNAESGGWEVKKGAFWRALLGFSLAALPWYGFSLAYFGALSPVTLAAKQGQYQHIVSTQSFLRAMVVPINNLRKSLGNALFAPYFALAIWGLLAMVRHRSFPPLMQWSLLYVASYTVLRVASYPWYYVPLVPAALWLLLQGLCAAVAAMTRKSTRYARLYWTAGCILLAFLAAHSARQATQIARDAPPPPHQAYREVGEWLAANTPSQARVGALEIGLIGFYSRRPIVDFAGLIQPGISRLSGPSYSDWTRAAIRKYRPDYVALVDAFRDLGKEKWFEHNYVFLHDLPHAGHFTTIYRRRDLNARFKSAVTLRQLPAHLP